LDNQVSTASTKSSTKKKRRAEEPWGAVKSGKGAAPIADEPTSTEISERTWWIAAASIFAVGAFLRLYNLNLVPLHHDEGVNGNFLVTLVRSGSYQYNPENYHGPSLYYLSAAIPWTIRILFGEKAQDAYGLTTFNIRLVPVLFGLGTIWLVLVLRRQLGSLGTLSAAALLAISPGAVYLSRYFIHESLFVFFTLGIVVAAVRYYEDGHPLYLILLGASFGLLFATKETWIISIGVLIIALVSMLIYQRLRGSGARGNRRQTRRGVEPAGTMNEWAAQTLLRLGGPVTFTISLVAAAAIFLVLGVVFYSSFGKNWKGVYDSLRTFDVWTRTGQTAHAKEQWTYLAKWLPFQEAPLLVLGAIGAVMVVIKPEKPFALFAALWAFGIIAAYSLVPYKTPWLMLNFIGPLALIGGYAVERVYRELNQNAISKSKSLLMAVASAAVLWVVVSGVMPNTALLYYQKKVNLKTFIPFYQTIDLNFWNYDNDNEYYVYIYAHTRRDLLSLVNQIDRVAKQTDKPADTGITIVSSEYWPLPWYFRDYQRVGYYGHMSASIEPFIIASENQRSEMEATFGSRYRLLESGLNTRGTYSLRPGVDLLLYVRRDVRVP